MLRTSALVHSVWVMIFAVLAVAAVQTSPALAQDSEAEAETAAEVEVAPVLTPEERKEMRDNPANTLHLDLSTGGRVTIQLYPDVAPKHVERIQTLVQQGFYDGIVFHRVIDGFMAQTGDPTGTGQGGSSMPDLEEEFNRIPHLRGSVSMARTNDPNSANSQFFIVFYPRFSLDNKYTNFGRVKAGMQYVDLINRGEPPAQPSRIIQASLASQNKPMPNFAQPVDDEPVITVDDLNAPIG
ncbi:peptidylprolyl isomerase [Alterisphingorhabdus coralli]|uniref:Peptidyl-prolyl cis-trans isomerase n=1 Tax=Alterisphingorhabdus coralli TaxID=3071408 RepID=A0AA97F7S3_9SPHN|nr:peptidylprolyl isomerase [Parasphingorhabdus sp. SCSIO 66989]WOE75974.1 peptidylprolyl isomerase [Parasphingorhabdus sp. SCSIO 66989]